MHQLHPVTLLKYLVNIRPHSAGLALDTAKHASPYLMNDTAKRWLSDFEAEPDPFFLYIHYNEPHRPYYPPNSHLERFTDEIAMSADEAAEFAIEFHYNLDEMIANGCDLTDDEWEAIFALYDAEIAYTDHMVGRLVDHVRSLDVGETIFVVTADHGELFGEHGLLAHSYVLDAAVTHIPMVIHGLGDLAIDPDDIVQHADVMRTLVERAGGDTEGMVGTDLRAESPPFAVSQRGPVDFDDLLSYNPGFDADRFHRPTLTALRTDRFVYQRSDEGADLFERPDETTDVSDRYPAVVAELDETLSAWLAENGRPADEGRAGDFSPSKRRQLEDLGYL